jgi:hypothetical protein
METVLPCCTFPNVLWWAAYANSDRVTIDLGEHFIKQSYRNRFDIAGHLGRQILSVSVSRPSGQKIALKDVVLFKEHEWKRLHLRSLKSAYNSSPWYSFYEEEIVALFQKDYNNLSSFNLESIRWLSNKLKLTGNLQLSMSFVEEFDLDLRASFKGQKWIDIEFERYPQVFEEKLGFISNLSALDVLFNLGPEAGLYIKRQPWKEWFT